ncbi:MAG: tetratricopeptide repeat protein [bacterium]
MLLSLSSCSQIGGYLKVIEGNYAFSRGEYQQANFLYIQKVDQSEYSDRLLYNLGNVYHSLGESQAALEEWEKSVSDSQDPELLFRIAFNRGVLHYEMGNYQSAYGDFRRALRLNPDDVEAKANLEFCLRKLNLSDEQQSARQNQDNAQQSESVSEDGSRILEYVKRSSPTLLSPDYETEPSGTGKDW